MRSTGDGLATGDPYPPRGPLARAAAETGGGPAQDEPAEQVGYRGPTACAATGITYRQLDYWARTGLVEPSVRAAQGSGSARLYSFRDILVLKVVKRLLDTGISLQQIRAAVAHLHSRGTGDLAKVTLMSDGVSVYECTSSDEVVDLLQGGQGVFGIALGRIWQEVDGTLAELPAETPIEIWFQDEARIGQKNGLVRQWARRGSRPRQPADQRCCDEKSQEVTARRPRHIDRAGIEAGEHLQAEQAFGKIERDGRGRETRAERCADDQHHEGLQRHRHGIEGNLRLGRHSERQRAADRQRREAGEAGSGLLRPQRRG